MSRKTPLDTFIKQLTHSVTIKDRTISTIPRHVHASDQFSASIKDGKLDAKLEHGVKLPPGTLSGAAESNDLDEGEIGAVLIYSRILDAEVWLVRDAEALADIACEVEDRPVFFFDEIERLRGKSEEELRAIAKVKCAFGPGARVVQ